MNAGRILWVVGAYLVGTIPSTYLISRAKQAADVIAASHRRSGEGDAHVLMKARLGGGWAALAATLDVVKGLAYPLVVRRYGHAPEAWVALSGVFVVFGYAFPFYARRMAGRGLAAAAGVMLALVPWAMVVAGVIIVLGFLARSTGLASTVGFAATPLVAAVQGQPRALVAMTGGVFAVILARRVEGVSDAAARVGWPRALLRRLLFDADRPSPEGSGAEEAPPA